MLKNSVDISIPIENDHLSGLLQVAENSKGIIIFAHGSGSSRLSKRNQMVANVLYENKFATLLFDLLTSDEEIIDEVTREHRFNIQLLADRLFLVTQWVRQNQQLKHLPISYFGASTGAAAALLAATYPKQKINAIVSRGGRADLARSALAKVNAATLLIVGGEDKEVIKLNEFALQQLNCVKKMVIVPGASHLFEEAGKLEQVIQLSKTWFEKYN